MSRVRQADGGDAGVMDNPLIARVAKAIYRAQFDDDWPGDNSIEAALFEQSARAAIAELTAAYREIGAVKAPSRNQFADALGYNAFKPKENRK